MSEKKNGQWSMVIQPKRHLLDIDFKEIWRYRDLIALFVRRDLVAQYKQTILGPLWYVINPLLTSVIYTVIFGNFAGISTDGLPKMLFYMSGTVACNYFASCLTKTSGTFTPNAGIFGKVYFPRLVMPLSAVLSNLLQFFIQFLFLGGFMAYFAMKGADFQITRYVFFVPLLIVMMALQGLGFGIIISSLTTKYRDLNNLVSFGVRLWMYATPVIYPLSQIPAQYQPFIAINPMTAVVEYFRYGLLGAGTLSPSHLAYSAVFTVVVLLVGVILFNRIEKNFMDTV